MVLHTHVRKTQHEKTYRVQEDAVFFHVTWNLFGRRTRAILVERKMPYITVSWCKLCHTLHQAMTHPVHTCSVHHFLTLRSVAQMRFWTHTDTHIAQFWWKISFLELSWCVFGNALISYVYDQKMVARVGKQKRWEPKQKLQRNEVICFELNVWNQEREKL